jgi:hypothetical protein
MSRWGSSLSASLSFHEPLRSTAAGGVEANFSAAHPAKTIAARIKAIRIAHLEFKSYRAKLIMNAGVSAQQLIRALGNTIP